MSRKKLDFSQINIFFVFLLKTLRKYTKLKLDDKKSKLPVVSYDGNTPLPF